MKIGYILLLLYVNITYAQSVRVRYEERANIENQLKHVTDPEVKKNVTKHLSKPVLYVLFYQDGVSLYIKDEKRVNVDEDINLVGHQTKKIEIGKNSGGIYKNQLTKEYLQEADVLGKRFLVKDLLHPYSWNLTEQEKLIGNFKVIKATATINDDHVEAWYAVDLPIQDGPNYYYGLPGLIIELHTDKKSYYALEVEKNADKIKFDKPSRGERVTRFEYQKILKKKIDDLKRGIGNATLMD